MIHGLCLEGLFDEAESLLSKMEDNGCIPKAEKFLYEMIARGLL
jgi:pentatricopeptide repeat domain-containing protein 1/leucine-rich PPR motif-containing protein